MDRVCLDKGVRLDASVLIAADQKVGPFQPRCDQDVVAAGRTGDGLDRGVVAVVPDPYFVEQHGRGSDIRPQPTVLRAVYPHHAAGRGPGRLRELDLLRDHDRVVEVARNFGPLPLRGRCLYLSIERPGVRQPPDPPPNLRQGQGDRLDDGWLFLEIRDVGAIDADLPRVDQVRLIYREHIPTDLMARLFHRHHAILQAFEDTLGEQ